MKLPLIILALAVTGCAEQAVMTDPASGITYCDKGVQADILAPADKVEQVATTVLRAHGFQIMPPIATMTNSPSSERDVNGEHRLNGARVRIFPASTSSASGATTHVEVVTTEGTVCSNMDYAGQILQDIVKSK